jgi:hypothetical protein
VSRKPSQRKTKNLTDRECMRLYGMKLWILRDQLFHNLIRDLNIKGVLPIRGTWTKDQCVIVGKAWERIKRRYRLPSP